MSPSLARLLAPEECDAFLAERWQRKHCAIRGSLERFGEVVTRLAGASVPELVRASGGDVQAWFTDREGRYRSIVVSPSAGLALYDAGMTLYIPCADPDVRVWLRAIAKELGRDPEAASADLFASRTGERVGLHFDRNENFTVQLRGKKRWHVAEAPKVERPVGNWVVGMPEPHWLRQIAREGLPRAIPAGADAVDLEAGTMFYVPAGHWHATETFHDSLSLNLNLTGRGAWVDVASSVVGGLLATDPNARAYARGAFAPEQRTREVHAELDRVLDGLRERLARVRAVDVWGPAVDAPDASLEPGTRLRRNPLGAFFVEGTSAEGERVVVSRHGADEELRAVLPHALGALGRFLREREAPFTVAEALEQAPFSPADARSLLGALVAFGYLSPIREGEVTP